MQFQTSMASMRDEAGLNQGGARFKLHSRRGLGIYRRSPQIGSFTEAREWAEFLEAASLRG